MHDGHYILPAELAALVAFLFGLPLLLAFIGQTVVFASRSMFTRRRLRLAIAGYAATVLGGAVVGVALLQFAPSFLNPVLRVQDIALGGQLWPVMPLAFVAVAVAAVVSTRWVLARAEAVA
jgi:hypothetical protein